MSEPAHRPAGARSDAEEWRRKRRLAEVFGDVLPETTRDEREDGGARDGARPGSENDAWLRSQVPPHHGG